MYSLQRLGLICRNWRKENDLSQSEIGKAYNIDKSIISKFEHGHYNSIPVLLCYVEKGFKL